jgi:hypothetical protein
MASLLSRCLERCFRPAALLCTALALAACGHAVPSTEQGPRISFSLPQHSALSGDTLVTVHVEDPDGIGGIGFAIDGVTAVIREPTAMGGFGTQDLHSNDADTVWDITFMLRDNKSAPGQHRLSVIALQGFVALGLAELESHAELAYTIAPGSD